jgi:hypothetical protein
MPTRAAVLLIALLSLPLAALGAAPDGYMSHDALRDAVRALSADARCSLEVIGTSREEREVFALTLSAPEGEGVRPALLITAGVDGRHLVGTETAMRVARRLLDDHGEILESVTVYVLPRVNPDAAERHFTEPAESRGGTLAPVDDDHDRLVDEDPPADVNGDGLITRMRRGDPPLDTSATHMPDPAAPRLLKKASSDKGETALYAVYVEGLDTDGDGLIAEDGAGYVDLDRNFPHRWPEFDPHAGPYQLSEPESAAVARFVLAHKNIVCGVTFGRHDNLVNPPDGKGKDVTGRGPKSIDSKDVELYKTISELFKETTEQSRAPKEDIAGSLHAWLYAQRGVPSFATVVWGRPDPSKAEAGEDDDGTEEAEAEDAAAVEPAEIDPVAGSWTGTAEVPEVGPVPFSVELERAEDGSITGTLSSGMGDVPLTGTFGAESGDLTLRSADPAIDVSVEATIDGDSLSGSVSGPFADSLPMEAEREAAAGAEATAPEAGAKKKDKPADAEAAAWLEYSDRDRDGAGFVEWAPFDHPTLGPVEIGGFAPLFRMNPPAADLDGLAEGQAAFVAALAEKVPALRIEGPVVKRLADGLYDVRLGIINDGEMPTATHMARANRAVAPTVVRVSTPIERIVAGDRVNRAWGIDGSGGRATYHWILRIDQGTTVRIDIANRQLGDRVVEFVAE